MGIKKHLKTYAAYRTLMKNQFLSRDQIRDIQENKLRRLVKEAYNNVPYYKYLFDDAGITDRDINTLDDLKKIPITTKADMQSHERVFLLNKKIPLKDLTSQITSGSSGRPFTIYFDNEYKYIKHAAYLRASKAAGSRFGDKTLTISRPGRTVNMKSLSRMQFASYDDLPEIVLAKINRFRPDTLFASVEPLKRLAEYIRDTKLSFHKPRRLITSAEHLDLATREFLESCFGVRVFDHYGATEMSLIAWECSEHNGHHLDEDCKIVEYQPIEGLRESSRIIITNLELISMPFIRYEIGDVGIPQGAESICACGRTFLRLGKVEGKIVDCISLEDGRKISPYSFTLRIQEIKNLKQYQIKQNDYTNFTVVAEVESANCSVVENEIRRVMHSMLGSEVTISVTITDRFVYPKNRKFRIVESNFQKERTI